MPSSHLRYDIATNLSTDEIRLVLGGEISMWTDGYASRCAAGGKRPRYSLAGLGEARSSLPATLYNTL